MPKPPAPESVPTLTAVPESGVPDSDKSEEELRQMLLAGDFTTPEVQKEEDNRPAWLKEMREPTKQELMGMKRDELNLVFKLKGEGKLKKQ